MPRPSRSVSCDDSHRCGLSCSPFLPDLRCLLSISVPLLHFISPLAVLALMAKHLAASSPDSPGAYSPGFVPPVARQEVNRARDNGGCPCAGVHTVRVGLRASLALRGAPFCRRTRTRETPPRTIRPP